MIEAQFRAIKKYRNKNREKYNEYQANYKREMNKDDEIREKYNQYMNNLMKRKYILNKEFRRLSNILTN